MTSPPTTTQPTRTTELKQIAFFNPSNGFALYETQFGNQCAYLLGASIDGGAVFTDRGVVDAFNCETGDGMGGLAFDDHGDGFAYGPQLFESHDNGASWNRVHTTTGSVLTVAALGKSVWLLQTSCTEEQNNDCLLSVLQSNDGGRTWVPSPSEPPPSGAADLGNQASLVRTSATAAYVFSQPGLQPPNLDPHFWHTIDGGRTWVEGTVLCAFKPQDVAVTTTPSGELVALCGGEPGAGNQMKSTSISTDDGRTWSFIGPCQPPADDNNACFDNGMSGGYIGALDATTDATFYALGFRAVLYTTRDGGNSWIADPHLGDLDGGGEVQVIFFDPNDGIVLGEEDSSSSPLAIWHTSDAGRTWDPAVPVLVGAP